MVFRVLLLCVAFVAFSCVFAQSKDAAGTTISDKVRFLNDLTSKRSFIKLNAEKFKMLVRSSPRNYSMIVMFTALAPGRGCQICREVLEEYQIVANSWRFSSAYGNSELFFASVDFDEGSEVFQLMNLNSAPVIIHFPPKGKRKSEDTYEIQKYGFSAEAISKWAMDRTGIVIRIFRPPNYSGTIAMSLMFIIVAGVLFMKRNNLEFIYNTSIWGVLCLLVIFAMTSGQMWNHMRGPPFAHRNPQTGQVSYINPSSQGQFIAETHLVMVLYGLVSCGFIFLINSGVDISQKCVPSEKEKTTAESAKLATAASTQDVSKRRIMVIGALVVISIFFSLTLSIFRGKYQGYPYSFLFR